MKIALDYDKTYNADKRFWDGVIKLAEIYGHEVRIVTVRNPTLDNIDGRVLKDIPIIYTDGLAKKFFCHHNADNYNGWDPDVWIDDKPETVINNSSATREILAAWRAGPEHDL